MIIRQLVIKNFGKIHDRTLSFSPGINVLYGENESGKTTVHTFIKGMLYGMTRMRGKAARNDAYSSYEPWENPTVYGGSMWFSHKGKNFRLMRNFSKANVQGELLCEDDGSLLDPEQGTVEGILGVSEAVYDNTVSVAQLKSVTGQDLVRELQNYMASYQGTGDNSIDLGRAMQMLKMSRKGFQVQEDRKKKELEKEQEKIGTKIEYLRGELEELREKSAQVEKKEESLRMKPGEDDGEAILDERIDKIRGKKAVVGMGTILILMAGAGGGAALIAAMDMLIPGILCIAAGIVLAAAGFVYNIRLGEELERRTRLKERWLSKQEKIKWNKENLGEAFNEKETAFRNLQAEYKEYVENAYLPSLEEMEIQAINMAMDTIAALSGNIHDQVGIRLKKRTSQILSEITGGKYQEVLMDRNFHMTVNTSDRTVPLERLSRGTMEQIYFALRMAAGELLCGSEPFPVILDDVFGMYDEDRLAAVLGWLHKEQKQIIISTCHKREMEILEKEGIPYNKILLTKE